MSYDFLLLPREAGQSWHELLDANERLALEEGDRRLSPAARCAGGSRRPYDALIDPVGGGGHQRQMPERPANAYVRLKFLWDE